MGTSSSSKGPGGGVPMVPPWVPDPAAPPAAPDGAAPGDENAAPPSPPASPAVQPGPIASGRRFSGARLALGKFASTGDRERMSRGLAQYVRSGYGGSSTATRRFGGTARTAGVLYGALSPAGRGAISLPGGNLDPAVLSGRSADEVMNAVVEAVRPVDGTLDTEASRAAIKDALSELLSRFPDAELLDLTEEQRLFAVERYAALDVYRRFRLDVGKTIQDKAPTVRAGLARLKEVKDYIKETVSAAFRKLTKAATLTSRQVARLTQGALKETFDVFESYFQ
jgi:hypothetical protein